MPYRLNELGRSWVLHYGARSPDQTALAEDLAHPIVARWCGDRHRRSGDPRARPDGPQPAGEQSDPALRLVYGGDAGVRQAVDHRRVGARDIANQSTSHIHPAPQHYPVSARAFSS